MRRATESLLVTVALAGAGIACSGAQAAGSSAAAQSGYQAPLSAANHALIITVSGYRKSPLPGVALDRETALELARRLGVPHENVVELAEQQVTREGLKQAIADMNEAILPGDKLFVYFSGHGARFLSKETNECTESIVMQDMHVVTNREFARLLRPLSARADKTIVMLDSCHSGGVARAAASRGVSAQRPKYSPEASSPECSQATNARAFQPRGADLGTTDNNLVVLAAARQDEVAWDTLDGGALTYNVQRCLAGSAEDRDRSGALSMQELTACVQGHLDKTQKDADRQHATLAGNGELIAGFAPTQAPHTSAVAAVSADATAMLHGIFQQRDDRWQVDASVEQPRLKIGTNLTMTIRSQREGFVYVFYQGSRPESFYLLFPNQLDAANSIGANDTLHLPRADWSVTALGPRGTDHLLVMVSATPRDFTKLSLPAEYVSASGPFEKFQPSPQAAALITQVALLSAAAGTASCGAAGAKRDLGVAQQRCSAAFGASSVSVEEIE